MPIEVAFHIFVSCPGYHRELGQEDAERARRVPEPEAVVEEEEEAEEADLGELERDGREDLRGPPRRDVGAAAAAAAVRRRW